MKEIAAVSLPGSDIETWKVGRAGVIRIEEFEQIGPNDCYPWYRVYFPLGKTIEVNSLAVECVVREEVDEVPF